MPNPAINITNLLSFPVEEILQEAIHRLLAQGRYGYDPASGGCFYRSPGGSCCAVGLLIPDDVYEAEFEGRGALELLVRLDYPIEHIEGLLGQSLRCLQNMHDDMAQHGIELTLDNMIRFDKADRRLYNKRAAAALDSALQALKKAEQTTIGA